MFGRKIEKTPDIDSLIGENIKIIGKIEGQGNLRIDGIIEGDIDYKGDVIIGEEGKVNGDIVCNNISLAGTVNGNITSSAKLVLLPTGKLTGDIEIANFVVHESAFFEGNCKMLDENNKVRNLNCKKVEKAK